MSKIFARELAALADSGYLKGQPYSKYDCQGYIKALLKKYGIVKKWLGTNDMWRNHVTDIHLIRECPNIPTGAMLFTVNYLEKPPSRYKDGPNCKHVGIKTPGGYWHSTTGGVQFGTGMARWTHWAKLNDLVYDTPKYYKGKVGIVEANKVKVHYIDESGAEQESVTELPETVNVTSVEVYLEE